MLLTLTVLVLVVTLGRGEDVKVSPDEQPSCLYQNESYPAGTKFRPDACTFCRCPHQGGRARCAVKDCQWLANCLEYDRTPGECCSRCITYGCRHSDGKVYPLGQEVSRSNCETCFCPEAGGRTVCSKAPCPPAHCVDAVHDPDKCCARCPNGENCFYGSRIITAGQVIQVSRCKWCSCPTKHGWRPLNAPPHAVCTMTDC